ncbi:MAG TPA: LodA/GoxA family CTQ-dependent oxidase [Thermoanaerobaculia bacterium]|nr:LodA/GoxA family CTQ-dependent oxidase [Thermoanaerobaculia bacterium]
MEYRIFPAIGIARIGNSPDIFIGPESIGSRGHDLTAAGETEVRDFKDAAFRTKKQAARFHVYQRATPADPFVPATLPAGASIRWTVRVANKKDGIQRPSSPPDATTIPGLRPTPEAARANRVIDSGNVSITGAGTAGQFLDGTHVGVSVRLGELRTDAQGRLLVVGADGVSKSNPVSPIGGSFYNNVNWHDDVCDGTVSAEVVLADGTTTSATGAWVIVAPPDFTPGSESVTSLYDEIQRVAVSRAWLPNPTATAFTRDIYPLLRRARSLRWSHGRKNLAGTVISEKTWNDISDDYPRLAKTDAAETTFRSQQMALVLKVETLLSDYQLTDVQKGHLTRWAAGTFASDWTGVPVVTAPTPDSLTEAALRGTAGQGFFPGIEGGRILTDPTIYQTPFDFRVDSAVLAPGDVTAMMAQPWQADFLKCSGNWWPSQRPDIAPQAGATFKLWARIGAAGATPTHQQLVDHVMQFGVVTPRVVGGVEVCLEEGRDTAAVGS